MKLLSEATEYALRAMVWMAQRPDEAHKVRDIADGTHAAPGYLVKVLQGLAKAGILSAQRGSNGGFTLRRNPSELSVLELINAVDPMERIRVCPLGLENHGSQLCPLHRRIDDAMGAIERGFAGTMVRDLLSEPSLTRPTCMALSMPSTPKDSRP